MQSQDAVIAKRVDSGDADTDEIAALAEAAGYAVVAELTQTRRPEPTYQFGTGKAAELAETVAETGADVVVFDNDLTPTQTVELAERCPAGTRVLDRYRLVLDIFEAGAGTERAKLQVERAKLRWRLPRIRERSDEQAMNRVTESGTRYYDVRDRIDELDRKLAERGDDAAARRETRREEGFAYVALAGYTNAGKSTLLHRLADDLEFEATDTGHADLDGTAEVEDRLFKTLETTTRRATIDGQRALVTDTVGFVDDVPHDSVASFHRTLSATEDAECVALVVDAADEPAEVRRKLATARELLADATGEVVVALNKVDLLDDGELAARRAAVADLAAESDGGLATDPVGISAREGWNLDALGDRIAAALPDRRRATLTLPNNDDAMSLVSWLYDRTEVEDVTYADDGVRVAFAGPPPVVERAKSKADSLAVEA